MITTTLNKIRKHLPCKEGWEQLLANLAKTKADDEPLPLTTILDSNGLDDCLWALRTVPEHDSLWRKYAVWCARQVEHLITDERSKLALDVAWRHSNGEATDEDLDAAGDAAWVAARDAAWVAARDAAGAAAAAAAWVAAWVAAGAAAAAAAAAWAAREAAEAAAGVAARDAQESKLRDILNSGAWSEAPPQEES
jgi:hypothetical protein